MRRASYGFVEILKFCMLAISAIAALWTLVDPSKPSYYIFLFFEPLSFLIITILAWKKLKYVLTRISLAIIYLSYFMRMAFLPLLMGIGSYATLIPSSVLGRHTLEAIILSVFEFLILSIYIFSKARYSKGNIGENYRLENVDEYQNYYKKPPHLLRFFVIMMIVYILYMFRQDQTIIRQLFSLIVGTPDDWYVRTDYRALGQGGTGVLGIMVTLIIYLFWYVQALVPPMLLIYVMNKYKNNKKKVYILTLLIAGIVLLITSGTRAHSVECCIAFLILAYSVFGDDFGKRIGKLIPLAVILVFAGIMAKSGLDSSSDNISAVMASYFGGVQNISTAIYGTCETSNFGIKNLAADTVAQIPILGNWIKSAFSIGTSTGKYFNYVISATNPLGQIIPCVGLGYSYFGPILGLIFAPILPLLAAMISVSFDNKAMAEKDIIKKNVYLIATIMMARAVVMTNLMSAVSYLFNTFVTLLIIYFGKNLRVSR